jgi:hypothetical protein
VAVSFSQMLAIWCTELLLIIMDLQGLAGKRPARPEGQYR